MHIKTSIARVVVLLGLLAFMISIISPTFAYELANAEIDTSNHTRDYGETSANASTLHHEGHGIPDKETSADDTNQGQQQDQQEQQWQNLMQTLIQDLISSVTESAADYQDLSPDSRPKAGFHSDLIKRVLQEFQEKIENMETLNNCHDDDSHLCNNLKGLRKSLEGPAKAGLTNMLTQLLQSSPINARSKRSQSKPARDEL